MQTQNSIARFSAVAIVSIATGLFFSTGPILGQSGTPVSNDKADSTTGGAAAQTESDQPHVHTIVEDMQPINKLLMNHTKIKFVIHIIPHGARTEATSSDPAIVKLLRLHATEMIARVKEGENIRPTDPLFVELFRHHNEIRDKEHILPNGVAVDETSANPQVVLLIRAHSRTVGQFVHYGMDRARKPSPLPQGYVAPAGQ